MVRGAATFVTTRKGGSCTQGGKPGTKETGTPESVPRTAAITRGARCCDGFSGLPHPIAEWVSDVRRVSRRKTAQ
ncbi:hypothetical protein C1893_31060 [Pseudomonas sp. MPR-ANC1]|nr:hypothetical protein C1893_31060 [Pseudomonas sp. MPR-ANC1]